MNATGRERQTDANHLVRASDHVNGTSSEIPSVKGREIGTGESDESGASQGGDRTRKLYTSHGRVVYRMLVTVVYCVQMQPGKYEEMQFFRPSLKVLILGNVLTIFSLSTL